MENHINFSQWFGIPELIAGTSLRNMQGNDDVIRSKLAHVFQLSGEGICAAVQTHSNKVKFMNKPLQNQKVDGLISRNKNIVLLLYHLQYIGTVGREPLVIGLYPRRAP